MKSDATWEKLAKSKRYREEFVGAALKRSIPFQIRALRKKLEVSQAQLAERANITQGVISRAEDPNYGNLTFNTVIRIAAGFDLAFVGQFVPFSELVKWLENLSEDQFDIPTFKEQNAQSEQRLTANVGALEGAIPIDSSPAWAGNQTLGDAFWDAFAKRPAGAYGLYGTERQGYEAVQR
jgi:transcriptional regulator with XRE-family HTH domain